MRAKIPLLLNSAHVPGIPGGLLFAAALFLTLSPARGDDLLAEADRLRREGTRHLENTLVPGFDEARERETGISTLEKARDLYEKAAAKDPSLGSRAEEAIVDINSQLFWARRDKKIDLGDDDEPEGKSREEEAREAFGAAEKYEKRNPRETFRIMVRYFEVAKRFIGTSESVRAQEKSFDLQNRIIETRRRSFEKGPCEQSLDVAAFEESFRSIPEGDANCLFYFGNLLESHWMDEEASRCYETILTLKGNPFLPRARARLGAAQIRLGRMESARATLQRGANEGEASSGELLAQISSSEFDRLLRALAAAKEKAVGGGKDALRSYRKVAMDMRKARQSLPLLPLEKVCSEITRLAARGAKRPQDRGSAPCRICSGGGEAGTKASFMTCPTCAGKGKVQKVRTVRVRSGRRWVRRRETYWDTCDECHGNKNVICKGCAGLSSVIGGMSKKEKKAIRGLRDEIWGKEFLVKASLGEAVSKVEKHVVKKKLDFLAHLDAPYHRSGDIRAALSNPPLADRVVPGDADALWTTAPGEVKFNFLLSWGAEFARSLAWVSFLDDPLAKRAISKGGPETAGEEVVTPEEAGAFQETLATGFQRVRGKLGGFGEDPDNPFLLGIDIASRFPHGLRFAAWKEEAQPLLEGLAGAYRLSYLNALVTTYEFSTEQKVRLLKPGTLVTLVGRLIPDETAPLFEVWRIEAAGM